MNIGPKIKNGGLLSCRAATIRFFWSKYIGNHINILITDQSVLKNPKKPVFYMALNKNVALFGFRDPVQSIQRAKIYKKSPCKLLRI